MPEENKDIPETPPKEVPFEKEAKEFKDKYLRALAEMENLKKRLYKEKDEETRFAIEKTIIEFLHPLDNFENALKFADSSSPEVKNWCSGFHMIIAQFKEVLLNHGVTAYHALGNNFDPHLHEAMEVEETNEVPDGKILEEFIKGYKANNRVIRPAKVKVARNFTEKKENKND